VKFYEYLDLAEQERKVVIDALLSEIYTLKKQLKELKRAEKKELILIKRNAVGFKQGGKNERPKRKTG